MSAGSSLVELTRDSAQQPDRPRQCFVLTRPILLLAQHGHPVLAFLLRSNVAHDAIDSDSIAPLVETLDCDYSLTGFHSDNMHFDSLISVSLHLEQDPGWATGHSKLSYRRKRGDSETAACRCGCNAAVDNRLSFLPAHNRRIQFGHEAVS